MKNYIGIRPHVLFIHFSVYFLEIPAYYPATALWTHKHLPWDPVTNTNMSPFLTQQALTPNQTSAGRLTCGQLGVNTCLSLDWALCASCIINCVGRLRGQELSCSQGAEPSHPLCCSFLLRIIYGSMDDVSFLYKNTITQKWTASQLLGLGGHEVYRLRVESSVCERCHVQYTCHLIWRKNTAS